MHRPERRHVLVLLAVLVAGGAPGARAEAWGLPELMQSLALHKSATARFFERKHISFLDGPVESSGELSFTAPDKLQKRTLQPQRETLTLDGDRLTVEQAGKAPMVISLASRPEAAAFVESMRATLAGDLPALKRYYEIELDGSAADWKLALVPKQPKMLQIVRRIRIAGANGEVRLIEFEQSGGDRSEMHISAR